MLRVFGIPAALAAIVILQTRTLHAQDERSLRRAFEGKHVTVHLDMPASSEGVDVFPGSNRPIDFQKLAGRLKKYGVAIKDGESSMITLVKVKGDHVEIQLGGGGYGTFGDVFGAAVTNQGADSGTAQQARIANERTARLAAGSRFNLRYPNGTSSEDLSPEAIVRALGDYATISGFTPTAAAPAPAAAAAAPAPDAAAGDVRKGQSREDIERLAGAPLSSATSGQITTNTYKATSGSGTIEVDYYNGVAVDVRQVAAAASGTIHKGMDVSEVERLAGKPFETKTNGAITTQKYHWQGGVLEGDFVNGVLVAYRITSN